MEDQGPLEDVPLDEHRSQIRDVRAVCDWLKRAWSWSPLQFAADANLSPLLRERLRSGGALRRNPKQDAMNDGDFLRIASAAEVRLSTLGGGKVPPTTLLRLAQLSDAPSRSGAESATSLLQRAGGAWSRSSHSLMGPRFRAILPRLLLVGERKRLPLLVWEWHVLSYLDRRAFNGAAEEAAAAAAEEASAAERGDADSDTASVIATALMELALRMRAEIER